MGVKGRYLREALYNAIFRHQEFTGPDILWVSLHNGDTGVDGENEVEGNGYLRLKADFSQIFNGMGWNLNTLVWPKPLPVDWGNITHLGLWDEEEGGNFYYGSELDFPVVTSRGVPPVIPPEGITVGEL